MKQNITSLSKCIQNNDFNSFKSILQSSSTIPIIALDKCVNQKSGETLLHQAAKCGNIEILSYLISLGCSFNQGDYDGKCALHCACQYENLECVEHLLKFGSDVNTLKRADWTPLMLACAKGNHKIVKLLVEHGALLGLNNKDGWTAFHIACRAGSEDVVNFLLDVDCNQWSTVSKNGRTPLHTAALNGSTSVCRALLERCPVDSLDAADNCGSTPLMDALRGGHINIAQILLSPPQGKAAADLNKLDKMGRHNIHVCCEAGQVHSLRYLVQELGIDVNLPAAQGNSQGLTPLHFAAREGHDGVLNMLLECNGINTNSTDREGRTALDLATGRRHEKCIKLLSEANGHG